MTTKRIFGKFTKITLGLLGVSAIMASCAKEKTCTCSYTYTDNGVTETYAIFDVTTKTKDCEDMEVDAIDPDATGTVSCKEK